MNLEDVTHVVVGPVDVDLRNLDLSIPMPLLPGEPLLPAATPAQLELCAWAQQRVRCLYEAARTFTEAVRVGVWHAPSAHRQQQEAARLPSVERQARGLPY